jgi:hypothetical protein
VPDDVTSSNMAAPSEYSEEEYSAGSEEEEEAEWTADHLKLLYLVSRYAQAAAAPEDAEGWVRKNQLLVLMYECIVAGVLDYDYAPSSLLIGTQRVWMNITQEGKDDIDDLREGGLVNGLKLASENFIPITAYQASLKGMELLEILPQQLKDEVDAAIHGGEGYEDELLAVRWDPQEEERAAWKLEMKLMMEGEGDGPEDDEEPEGFFQLYTEGGYERESEITETEDVSYVSSPWLPECLRDRASVRCRENMIDNVGRAHESAAGESDIKDELSETITLSNLSLLVGEWIPFGSNTIVALNDKLGTADRCQGGMFTGEADKNSGGTVLFQPRQEGPNTVVKILDYDLTECINFEAVINFPESPGIIQVEEFGMHVSEEGFIAYSMKVEAIQDRLADDVSIDMLSRLLVDVCDDSSQIADSLLSFYQKSLLTMIYNGDEFKREKFNLLIAEGIEPKMEASRYMDREEHENELKQVLGDTDCAYNLSPDDVLIRGKSGMLIVGPNAHQHEPLLVDYLSLMGREMFVKCFFIRAFMLSNDLSTIRNMVGTADRDPTIGPKARALLSDASRDIITLQAVLGYLEESLLDVKVPPRPTDLVGKRLFTIFDLEALKDNLQFRIDDLEKSTAGALSELQNITATMDVITCKQQEKVWRQIMGNTKTLVDASAADERGAAALEVMEIIFSASMGFDIFIRIFGIDQGINTEASAWHLWMLQNVVWVPGGWFCCNMFFTFLVCAALKWYMGYLGALTEDYVQVERLVNQPMDTPRLMEYIRTKTIESTVGDDARALNKTTWQEEDDDEWGGAAPKITIIYDDTNDFFMSARLDVDKKRVVLPEEAEQNGDDVETWVSNRFLEILLENEVLFEHGKRRKGQKLGGMLGD